MCLHTFIHIHTYKCTYKHMKTGVITIGIPLSHPSPRQPNALPLQCVYIYTCIHTCIYIGISMCMYTCIHIHTYICMYTNIETCDITIGMSPNNPPPRQPLPLPLQCTYIHTYIHTCISIRISMCIYTYIHIHTYRCTYVCINI